MVENGNGRYLGKRTGGLVEVASLIRTGVPSWENGHVDLDSEVGAYLWEAESQLRNQAANCSNHNRAGVDILYDDILRQLIEFEGGADQVAALLTVRAHDESVLERTISLKE